MRVNKHQRTAAIVILTVIVGAILVAALVPSREPQYEGKPLSYWVEQLWTQPERHTECNKAIQAIGPQAVPFLINQARRQDSAYERLYRFTWPRLPAVLQRRIPQPAPFSYDLHRTIGFVLGLIGAPALPQLLPALKDRNDGVRLVAVEAMERIAPKSDSAVRLVAKLVGDSNGLTRVSAVGALGLMQPNSALAVPDLIRALRDSDIGMGGVGRSGIVFVRANAARVLGEFGRQAQTAIPELRKLLNTGDSYTRQQAAVALWRIDHDTNVISLLIAELQQAIKPTPILRRPPPGTTCLLSLQAFAEMGPSAKAAVPVIIETMNNLSRIVDLGMAPQVLLNAAQDALAKIDSEIAGAIGIMGPKTDAALPALISLLNQTNDEVRVNAVFAISQLGTVRTQAIPALVRALKDSNRGPNGSRAFVREAAARALGEIGPEAKAAVPDLTALLDDPELYTQGVAGDALWRITHDTNLISRFIADLKKASNAREYRTLLEVLAQIGPAAKSAVPVILGGTTNFQTDMSRPIRRALRQIDPDAVSMLNKPGK